MTRHTLSATLLLSLLAGIPLFAHAEDVAATKAATAQFEEDKKLCASESTSGARMQCLRDANAEYKKALADAKKAPATKAAGTAKPPEAAVTTAAPVAVPAAPAAPAADSAPKAVAAPCMDCGRVTNVNVVEKKGEGSALGVIGGGLAGALLGNQVGGGTGKTLATIAGAAGGAYAGNKVEANMKSAKAWVVRVRMDNGDERSVEMDRDPGLINGDLVRVSGNSISRR
jgi:outer membrane lipoprotein SlyB